MRIVYNGAKTGDLARSLFARLHLDSFWDHLAPRWNFARRETVEQWGRNSSSFWMQVPLCVQWFLLGKKGFSWLRKQHLRPPWSLLLLDLPAIDVSVPALLPTWCVRELASCWPCPHHYLHEPWLKTYDNIKHSWFYCNAIMRIRLT